MNWVKGFALVTCLGASVPVIMATTAIADPAPAASPSAPSDAAKAAPMSDADKRAKAADCSKQADAKSLHGEARKKFRAACKRGK